MVSQEVRIKWVQRTADVLLGAASKWPALADHADERYAELHYDMRDDGELWAIMPDFIRKWSAASVVLHNLSLNGLRDGQLVSYIEAAMRHTLSLVHTLPEKFGGSINDVVQVQTVETISVTPDPMTVEVSLGSPSLISPAPTSHRVVNSSVWTGRRSAAEQASHVRTLVPDAVVAINRLIAEQQAMRLHNNPPEALQDNQMGALKALRDALTDLLEAVEREQPFENALGHLRACIGATFGFARETGQLLLANSPAVGTASVFGWGTYAIATMVAGIEPGAAATLAAGKMAVSAIKSKR